MAPSFFNAKNYASGFWGRFSQRQPWLAGEMAQSIGYVSHQGQYLSPWKAFKTPGIGFAAKAQPLLAGFFIAQDTITGFKEGGISGAVKGAAGSVASNLAASLVFKTLASGPGLVGVAGIGAAAVGIGAGQALISKAWQTHVNNIPLEFVGSTAAFNSAGAYTMRQRSVASIQKSYLNARSAFGQEANYLHISKYRGMRR